MSNDTLRRVMRRAAALALPLALGACENWFTTFAEQPRVEPWEMLTDSIGPRGNPHYSVPIYGDYVPGYFISYQQLPATLDSFALVENPIPMSQASVLQGWKYYAVNCAVCHGYAGAGDGPVTKYGFPGISLLTPLSVGRSDGYIFGIIRNGRGLMPPYNRIEEMNRWDIVNYLRALQGVGGIQPPVGPVGVPGETGDKLPGFTVTAPTRPSPYTAAQMLQLRDPSLRGPGLGPTAGETFTSPDSTPVVTPSVPPPNEVPNPERIPLPAPRTPIPQPRTP